MNITLSCRTGNIYNLAEEAVVFFHDLPDNYRVFFEFNGTLVQIERGDTADRLCCRWSDTRRESQARAGLEYA
jgi:hypothetical protein